MVNTNLVTPQEVEAATGISVSTADITKAQRVIETNLGCPLAPTDAYSDQDMYLLKSAVVWEVAYLDTNATVVNAPDNIASASTNGVSVTYREGLDPVLAPMARQVLFKLSWMKSGAKTVFFTSIFRNPVQDTLWKRIN